MKKSFEVLAVENESAYGLLLEHALSPLTVTLRLLRTASEAREFLNRCPVRRAPDAVLLDLKLLSCTGLDLLRWIRTQPQFQALPVVVVSGREDASDVNRAFEMGVDGYVAKPAPLKELAMTLSGVLVTHSPIRPEVSEHERWRSRALQATGSSPAPALR